MQLKQTISDMHFLIIIFILFYVAHLIKKLKFTFNFIFLILLLILCTED